MRSHVALSFAVRLGLAIDLGMLGAPAPAAADCEPPELVLSGPEIGENTYGYCGAIDSQKTAWLQTIFPQGFWRRRWEQPFDGSQDAFGFPPSPGLSSSFAPSVGIDIDELGHPVVSSGGATRLDIFDPSNPNRWKPLIFKPTFLDPPTNQVFNTAGVPNKFAGTCTPLPGYACIAGPSYAVRARGGRVYVAQSSGNVFEATLNPNRTVNTVREIANYTHAPVGPHEFIPTGLDVDEAGGVYVASTTATLFVPPPDANGMRTSPVQQLPGPGTRGYLNQVWWAGGIVVDAGGRVFVVGLGVDEVPAGSHNNIGELWMFSRDANGQWVCGAVEAGECAPIYRYQEGSGVNFKKPMNVAIDEAGVLYVVNQGNTLDSSLIRMKVAADGQVTATTILAGFFPPTQPEDYFQYAFGVGVDRKGTLVYGATEGNAYEGGLVGNGLWQVYLDSDDDDVCDYEDNCLDVANGPANASNQIDTDGDGFGNACDADYTQDNVVGGPDQAIIQGAFGTSTQPVTDHDGNGVTGSSDLVFFWPQWGDPPKGRSGFDCADRTICIAGNSHCTSGPDTGCPPAW